MESPVKQKRSYLGWMSFVVAFIVPPFGAMVAIVLASIALFKKDHDNTTATVGLIFGIAMLIALVLFPVIFARILQG